MKKNTRNDALSLLRDNKINDQGTGKVSVIFMCGLRLKKKSCQVFAVDFKIPFIELFFIAYKPKKIRTETILATTATI